ncbi:alpha/beta hydrolase-fold protein [Speluncibacter jeojiensis]|uniref:Alpha/beta hydrolase-fold protein n=1 Tax=Speluncibacter jeojiensis TaxID=2710754 RepID=A0A9X4LZR3_9ACTN|nr:alpha/beta hydrolase-fold protein [Rhodococcus sp. D2-41]MDG3014192.1 alpha/beta hydrolase-fold protein [Corynebacteriales bacterium D3-21]
MLGLCAAAAVLPLTVGLASVSTAQAQPLTRAETVAHAQPMRTADTVLPGVKVDKVDWLTAHRVALWVYSPAMGTDVQVQILLARDWYANPNQTFPQLLTLDGLRATDDQSGWTINTDIVNFFADKNVNVVLPVGGQSSFYTDWLKPDNGHNYQWETFLTKELPPILHSDWRTSDVAGLAGLSMGGTAAMMLAERHPDMFKFVASYSGILNTTSLGMPQAIQVAMLDAGGFHSENMWGLPSNPAWADHDPMLHADKLKGMSIYISSGNGVAGPYDQVGNIPGISTNFAGMGLEILSRLTSQNFAQKLNKLGISANVIYRPSGTHSWPYWQFEMHQSWPQVAQALNVEPVKPPCSATGAIGGFAAGAQWLGPCTTAEYAVPGGRAQDFLNGQVFWSQATGAQSLGGAIGGEYQNMGGSGGKLGFPKTVELGTPDRRGRFNLFQNGSIYWTIPTGAHAVYGDILTEWGRQGFERGPLGYPTQDQIKTPNKTGQVQAFQIGAIYSSPGNGTHSVQGEIMKKYGTLGYEDSYLGFPKTNELGTPNGQARYNGFENGNIYWSAATGAWAIRFGPIWDAWQQSGFEAGKLGLPVGDQTDIPAGGVTQNFQHGTVTVTDGKTAVTYH